MMDHIKAIPSQSVDITHCQSKISLDQLEREEEEYEAKMKGIAEIQASLPIGVTPVILGRHERKMQELRESTDEGPSVQTLFWNRKPQHQDIQTIPNQFHRINLPLPGTPAAKSMSHAYGTPRSAMATSSQGGDFSYSLDTPSNHGGDINSASILLDTPMSHQSSGSGISMR